MFNKDVKPKLPELEKSKWNRLQSLKHVAFLRQVNVFVNVFVSDTISQIVVKIYFHVYAKLLLDKFSA